jgi:hypothetical protein
MSLCADTRKGIDRIFVPGRNQQDDGGRSTMFDPPLIHVRIADREGA